MGTKLRYDRRSCKTLLILMVIAAAFFAFGLICVLLFDDYRAPFWLIITATMGLMTGGPLTLLFAYLFADAKIYLNRLSRNRFIVPNTKAECSGMLEKLSRTGELVTNNYSKDSARSLVLCIIFFFADISGDIWYLHKWSRYQLEGSSVLFVMLLIFHAVIFLIPALVFLTQRNTKKYIDNVDIIDGRKVRMSIMASILLLTILSGIGAFGVVQANSMTSYIYKSKYGRYEKTHEDFLSGASMEVTSDSLTDGVWNSEISDMSPELTFEPVDGAEFYVIYMVDESSNNRLLWYASHVGDTSVPEGSGTGEYTGPDLPSCEGGHNLTVYVYALQGEPGRTIDLTPGDSSLSGDLYYYDILNVIDGSSCPELYGNVLAYGYITHRFSPLLPDE